METNNEFVITIGDWVKGTTKKGELIHGYVESFQPENMKVELKVVESDNQRIIGNIVILERSNVQKLESSFRYTEEQLEDLINLALETRDENWFIELSSEWKKRNNSGINSTNGKKVRNNYYEKSQRSK